jgi:lysophospholipase L1-like esterase
MKIFGRKIRTILGLCTGLVLSVGVAGQLVRAAEPVTLVNPVTPHIRKVLDYPLSHQMYAKNTDCTDLSYRFAGDSTMQDGCFVGTANGYMQAGGPAIFNGTDEALPIDGKSYTIVPVPNQPTLMALSGAPALGVNLLFYGYGELQDEYLWSNQHLVRYKTPSALPNVTLEDNQHQPVAVNPDTNAFSANGNWLVTESPRHALIRVNMATLQITAFAPPFNTQPWDYSLPMHPMAISEDGRYVAVQGDTTRGFRVYDLSTCSANNELISQPCAWHDYWPLVLQTVPTVYGQYGLGYLRFVNDETVSFDLRFNDVPATDTKPEQWQSARYTLSVGGDASAIDYLAIGDSYTSGEGTFNYATGTDTTVNHCHLSPHAYPFLIGQPLFNQTHSVACSGATTSDIDNLSNGYYGQAADHTPRKNRTNANSILANFNPGYLAQQEFVTAYQPDVLTVSVGGNDVGYADILQQCVEPHLSHNSCYSTYEDKAEVYAAIDRKYRDALTLYARLKAAAPHSTIYAIGYPQVAVADGNCALNVHLDHNELLFAISLVDHLNAMIKTAAANEGLAYVDISQVFVGHRLCETGSFNVAMNGLTSGTDAGLFGINFIGKESFHPNAFGHTLMANAILAKTHGFAAATPSEPTSLPPPNGLDSPDLSMAPKSGRPINQLVWDASITSGAAQKNQGLALTINGGTDGLAPNSDYRVMLDRGDTDVGHATTDGNGDIATTVIIPGDTDPGTHTIDVTGQNPAGEPIDVSGPVYVPDSPTDDDGDGIPNANDSCPTVTNSGLDTDQDSVDDACDPLIGQPPTDTGGTTQLPNSNPGDQPNDPTQANPTDPPLQPADAGTVQTTITTSPTGIVPLGIPANGSMGKMDLTPAAFQRSAVPKNSPGLHWRLPKLSLRALTGVSLWVLLLLPLLYATLRTSYQRLDTS